jgi:hypothetical protein
MSLLSSLSRRAFFSNLLLGIPALAVRQSAILQKGKAVICEGSTVKCPLGHDTCREIDAPIVVGNNNRDYPDSGQLFDTRMLRCQQCGVLFSEKN